MKTKTETEEWLLENCVDRYGNLDLKDLDFSDFDGHIFISNMKVKLSLHQENQMVGGNLYQRRQKVCGYLYQDDQKNDPYKDMSREDLIIEIKKLKEKYGNN